MLSPAIVVKLESTAPSGVIQQASQWWKGLTKKRSTDKGGSPDQSRGSRRKSSAAS
jgi:hypothetical protein